MCKSMIDRKSRNIFAALIRKLAAGLITNDEFEEQLLGNVDSEDDAIRNVFDYGAWSLYSDHKEYRLKNNDALSSEDKAYAAKLILFLKSDYEYMWPPIIEARSILHRLSFGLLGKMNKCNLSEIGDINSWPFLNEEQFEQAKKSHGYLGINHT